MTNQRGLTIVEVLVALLLVSVGLLAMAGTSALALRVTSAAARERRAAERASTRVALLSAAGCAGARDGTFDDLSAPLQEQWTVRMTPGGMAQVSARVAWPAPGGQRSLTLASAFPC